MKRLLALVVTVVAVSAFADEATPLAMCAALEARMAAGDGVTLPDADAEIVRHAGTVDLSRGEWPEAFLSRAGGTICVAVSPFTGCYEFFDESGECFYTLVPVLATTENWVAPFRHAEPGPSPDDDLYAPWRLVDVWSLSHAESAESSGGASSPSEPRRLESHAENAESLVTRGINGPATNLCFTAFSFTETNLFFTAAWPTNEALPQSVLDLYGSTNLSSHWTFLSSHPATTNPVSFAVVRATLPWYVEPTQHVHDASCVSLTNVVLSPLDGVTVYTNAFWSCSTNRTPGECGFFRLGTRHDTDGDGFYDAAELLVHGTRPDRLDSDGDGVPDGISAAEWLSNPLWATNGMDADFIVDIVAPSDGSAETVLTLDGWRIPLSPLAGSRAFSLPPGEIVPCSVSSSGPFFILWAGTSGGSFWGLPESFEKPFWTDGIGNVSGSHTESGSCQIAVPVLAVEPDFGGGLRSGGSANGSHVGPDGSVCVHAADGIQRYTWSVAPAVVAAGRTLAATGAVQIESGNPFIDVSIASGVLSGSFGFGPGWAPDGGVLWGSLVNVLSAHRCDASYEDPFCSVCGLPCYDYASDHDIDYLTIVPEENDMCHLIQTIVRFPGSQQRVFRAWKSPDPDLHQPLFYRDAQLFLQEPMVFSEHMVYMETESTMIPDESPEAQDCSWRCLAGLSDPLPEYEYGTWGRFLVPLHGGVFKFRFRCDGISDSDAFLVLPLAGASVDLIVSAEIANADLFAAAVRRDHPSWFDRNSPKNGLKWFVNAGAGDCRGRPDSQSAPTVWYYNQVSDSTGFGAVCTWGGRCVRLAKISNFLVAYACQKIGVTAINQDISQRIGTRNDVASVISWDCGVDLANRTKTLSECAEWIGSASWRQGDEKLEKLWPNLAPADNFVEPIYYSDPNTQFTIPGFLRMTAP